MSDSDLIYNRRSIRLKRYDYSSEGLYFITICTYKEQCIFGEIMNKKMHLNAAGKIAFNEWIKSGEIRSEIYLDEFVVMPNHFHAIVEIKNINELCPSVRPPGR